MMPPNQQVQKAPMIPANIPVSYTHLDVYKRQTPDDDMAEDTFAPEEEVELMNEEETQVDPRWDELKKILDNN